MTAVAVDNHSVATQSVTTEETAQQGTLYGVPERPRAT